MNNKLLLVTCITLLFRESQISGQHENSSTLVRELVNAIKLPELSLGYDHEKEILSSLKSTAMLLCDAPVDHEFMASEIAQRLKVDCLEDGDLYESFNDGISPVFPADTLKRICLNLKRNLTNYLKETKISQIIHDASQRLKFRRGEITNMREFVAEVNHALEPYQLDINSKDPAVISDVDMGDIDAVKKVFTNVKDASDGASVMRTGFQGINRMLDGGFRRGEQWVIGALQHKFKTGFSLTLFKQIALYNTPIMMDGTKKPLLLRISFEDPTTLNFEFLYKSLKENETGQPADVAGIPEEDLARYVQERLSVNGYHTRFMHVNPSLWTYRDICNKIIELEADGYEVHMCMLDYLLKLPTTGCDQGPMGHDIRNMYERVANFMKARNICMITPHQLSTESKQMIRDGQLDFVKKLVGGGYYAGSKQIDQVVDGELFIHIEEVNGKFYLTVQRGKHRKIKQTPLTYQYVVLPFEAVGTILDDVNGQDTTRKRVGGGAIGSSNETPFWDEDKKAA